MHKCSLTSPEKLDRLKERLVVQYANPDSNIQELQAEKEKILASAKLRRNPMKSRYEGGKAVTKDAKYSFDTFYDILEHQLRLRHTQHTFQGRSNTIKPRNSKSNVVKRIA